MVNRGDQAEQDWISEVESYCEGYSMGFHFGDDSSQSPDELIGDDNTEGYKLGYRRGFATRRAIATIADEERKARRPLYDEVEHTETEFISQGQNFTPAQLERWKVLQDQVKDIGNRSWEDVLLNLYRYLESYREGARLSAQELSALRALKEGTVQRLSKVLRFKRSGNSE